MHNSQLTPDVNEPFFWRVGVGIMYAEMPFNANVRPPLLSEWESNRVREFRSIRRRNQWLAGRALAKALVRERLRMDGIIEIRDSADGVPLLYRNGLPMTDVWLSVDFHGPRISAVIADRPVALDMRRVDGNVQSIARNVVKRAELRLLRRKFEQPELVLHVAYAIKEAALRACRLTRECSLADVELAPDMSVRVKDRILHTLALRVVNDTVVAIVGRPLLEEAPRTRLVWDEQPDDVAASGFIGSFERQFARARRIAEARARWNSIRWQT